MGGWKTMPGSCSSGLRSRRRRRPAAALEGIRGEQDEGQQADADQAEHRQHARHHDFRQVARASDTAAPQPASISTHSSSEPSWPPQTAEKRYSVGGGCWSAGHIGHRKVVGEKPCARQPKARRSAGTASAPPAAPVPSIDYGRAGANQRQTPCARATTKARMSAKCPSSGVITWLVPSGHLVDGAAWRLRAACSSRRAWPAPRWR
jgi:hypothetical protein